MDLIAVVGIGRFRHLFSWSPTCATDTEFSEMKPEAFDGKSWFTGVRIFCD